MLRSTTLMITAIMFLTSCTKEKNVENTSSNKTPVLVKSATKFKTDSFTYAYHYNASQQLTGEDYIQDWGGTKDSVQTSIVRNAQGIIQQVIYRSKAIKLLGLDNFTFKIVYDPTQSKYISRVAYYMVGSRIYKDSSAYSSNASGQIIAEEKFNTFDSPSGEYFPVQKKEFQYDGQGNMIERKEYAYDKATAGYLLNKTYKNEYNAVQNPLAIGAEAILVDDVQLVSKNNLTKTSVVDDVNASSSYNSNTVYTLNSNNLPVTATINFDGCDAPLLTSYFYELK